MTLTLNEKLIEIKKKMKNHQVNKQSKKIKQNCFQLLHEMIEREKTYNYLEGNNGNPFNLSINSFINELEVFADEYLGKDTYEIYDVDNMNTELEKLDSETTRIQYLSIFSNISKGNIMIVGGNGAGKSSFVSYLKQSDLKNMTIIPAQKYLYFKQNVESNITLMEIHDFQQSNFIRVAKETNRDYEREALLEAFTSLIYALINSHFEELNRGHTEEVKGKTLTIFDELLTLWKKLLPDIEFEIDATRRLLIPVKNGVKYELNSLSEGEKAILYYICNVLLAEKNSFIVIDEPETYLNPSVFNLLWDLLEEYRSDCKFMYVSHTVDFILSRKDSSLIWCKNYEPPETWEFEEVNDGIFPKSILTELLGSGKKVLFCEGNNKDSIDYQIYTSLFQNDYLIQPVGGHREVIQYTKTYNHSPIINNNRAIGIIDGDLISEDKRRGYKENSIYALQFNEIEMLLCTEEVIHNVLKGNFNDQQINKKIINFKTEVFNRVETEMASVAVTFVKSHIDDYLSNYRIQQTDTIEEMEKELKNLHLNNIATEVHTNFQEELSSIIDKKDYQKLLELCPLKNEITKGLANKHLDNNYEIKAINQIRNNTELAHQLVDKYFTQIKTDETQLV